MKSYLSICATYRDVAEYLREWIEFHRIVGVDHFYLYDNGSEDDHREALAPYVSDGIVTVHDWPGRFPDCQTKAFDHCIAEHGDESRWIAFIDTDEFLYSPTGAALPEVLADYEGQAGVGVNWTSFGSSGHKTKPSGVVIENYVRRRNDSRNSNRFIKSIVDPKQVESAGHHSHFFFYRDGRLAVTENMEPIEGPRFSITDTASYSKLRINHYVSKSEEEYKQRAFVKHDREKRAASTPRSWERFRERLEMLNEHHDDTITRWAPAVRAALQRVEDQARA